MRLRFQRGTLVVEHLPEGLDVGELPGTLWDPRVGCYRAPASAYAGLCAALREAGVPFDDPIASRRATPGPFRQPELRPYQEAALDAWRLAGHRGTVVLPTGSGKTRLAIAALARTHRSSICLVPTRVLLDQWCRSLEAFYGGPVGRYGDGVRRARAITVATYASAERYMDRIGDDFAVLVADEVHNAAGGAWTDTFLMSTATGRLGLTATPPKDPAARARLAELVGPVVYELAVGDLAGTFLAAFDLVTLMLDLTGAERAIYERETEVFQRVFRRFRQSCPDAEWADFMRAASRSEEGRRAVSAWRHARRLLGYTAAKRDAVRRLLGRHADSRVLVFVPDNRTAYAVAREHLVTPITCDIKKAERQAALERFRRGELRCLVSARVLNEGLDVPDADVAIVVGGTLGEREHVQRVGRVLRPAPGKRALIYELVTRATTEVRQARQRRASLAPRISAQL